MSSDSQLWYIRVSGEIKGPFASGLISKNILLGRIHPNDEISKDKQIWHKASSLNEVMPDIMKHRHEANYKERLKAAIRWSDERGEVREKNDKGDETIYIPRRNITHIGIKTTGILGTIAFVLVILFFVYIIFIFTPDEPEVQIDCSLQGQDNSIFDNCHLQNRNFSQRSLKGSSFKNTLLKNSSFKDSSMQNSQFNYANLSNANLSNANFSMASLKGADLSNAILYEANFTQADMSYVNFTGAKIAKIKLAATNLSNAIWFDGRICSAQSIGKCLSK